jgi:PAS domain S-box-containing protein
MDQLDFPSIVTTFASASDGMLAAVLDQSADCIKVIGLDGTLDFMNRNGRCAMEIDDFALVAGRSWWDLWPEDTRPAVREAFERASAGEHVRFEAFCPTAKGTPRWWDVSVSPLRDATGALQGLVSISRDITESVGIRELWDATAAEMRHRLQNAYALTSAIIMATARGSPEREDFARELVERLQQLGVAQSLLLDADKLGAPTLDILVRRLTEPFCGPHCALSTGDLPHLPLQETQLRTLALAIGELSTNSNKYGALGHGGAIIVSAALDAGVLTLRWRESSEIPVAATAREGGAGLALIRRSLASSNGSLALSWRDDGLDVALTMPGFPPEG